MTPLNNEDLNQLIDEIIEGLSLEERVLIANTNEANTEILQRVFDMYVRSKIGDDADDDHTGIMKVLWKRLRDSHRLKVVK